MATRMIRIDDLDGTEGAKERHFTVADVTYSIDLTDSNYEAFLGTLKPYIDAARVERAVPKPLTKSDHAAPTRQIREWAIQKGLLEEGHAGRIPAHVRGRYYAENQ